MASKDNPLIITDDDGNPSMVFTGPVAFGGGHAAGGDITIVNGDYTIGEDDD